MKNYFIYGILTKEEVVHDALNKQRKQESKNND